MRWRPGPLGWWLGLFALWLTFCRPASAADVTFQRNVSPSASYTTMYDLPVSRTATSTAPGNLDVIYMNYPTGTRLISYFDLSSIPAGSTITQATLSYEFYNGAPIQSAIGVYRVRTNWLGGTPWTVQGGDWVDKNGTNQGTVPFSSVNATANGTYTWDITPIVQSWNNGTTPNYGMILKVADSVTTWGQTFASGHGTASVHPRLRVIYTPPSTPPPPPPPTGGTTTIFQRGVSPSATYTNMFDNEIDVSASSTPKTNRDVMYLNYPRGKRLISYFDVSAIPSGSTISNALLKYQFYNGAPINAAIDVFRVRTNWLGGTKWAVKGGDWADKNGTNQGAVPFATVQATTNAWYAWDITSLVQGWRAGTIPNYGVILKVPDAVTTWGQTFASGHGTAGVHPILEVTYNAPDTVVPAITGVTVTPTAKPYLADAITLTASVTDSDPSPVEYQFLLDGAVVRAWGSSASFTWTSAGNLGSRRFEVQARDAAPGNATKTVDVYVIRKPVSHP